MSRPFALRFPADEIPQLAERFSYSKSDDLCLAAGAAARARARYNRDELILICAWKTVRSKRRVASNSETAIELATGRAFRTRDEGKRMEALTELDGVGVPTGSALLYFAFPDDYPILDVRALESLGQKARTVYPINYWLEYLLACRRIVDQNPRQSSMAGLEGERVSSSGLRYRSGRIRRHSGDSGRETSRASDSSISGDFRRRRDRRAPPRPLLSPWAPNESCRGQVAEVCRRAGSHVPVWCANAIAPEIRSPPRASQADRHSDCSSGAYPTYIDVYPRTSPLHSAPGTTRSEAGSPCKSDISGL
jgi:hypothetical protein